MPRRRTGQDVDGVVFLDKAAGVSSNAALQQVRRLYDARKAGHTGSLDPLASGLLPVCLGEATKISAYLLKADKYYQVTAAYGTATTTGDAEGEIVERSDAALPPAAQISAVLAEFIGASEQIPPMYSALKQGGRRLYQRARAGETVAREPRPIRIAELRLLACDAHTFSLAARVSAGTYIRTLVEDVAGALGGLAHVQALRRVGVGRLPSAQRPMVSFAALEAAAAAGRADAHRWPLASAIDDWPSLALDARAARAFGNGQVLTSQRYPERDGPLRVYDQNGALLGLGQVDAGRRLAPKRVFARAQ